MAGGTSRKNHSEVGSSYIHFNFTPDGNKTTPSLIGDVPKGVMLNQPAIFLGGQGGIVGPVRLGYGNVVAAGSILRRDMLKDSKIITGITYPGAVIDFAPHAYSGLSRLVANNIIYMANLIALEQWYIHVRQSFFTMQEFGKLIYAGVLEKLSFARNERIKRFRAFIKKIPLSNKKCKCLTKTEIRRCELHDNIDQACELFGGDVSDIPGSQQRDNFLNAFHSHKKENNANYIEVIQSMPSSVSQQGVQWLDQIVKGLCNQAAAILPSLNMFKK
jgi:UDP-N-acetylglucosamine/UDP-N-acetylgalactosamine diphosphorylase